ncbi:MAG: site-specific integrase, partial [bacterium]
MTDTPRLTPSPPLQALSPTLVALAAIPEEEIWLAKQKSPRTRRAYRQDVLHFMQTVGVRTREELRTIDHKAVIAWERRMREVEG